MRGSQIHGWKTYLKKGALVMGDIARLTLGHRVAENKGKREELVKERS